MDISTIVKECTKIANQHGWKIYWKKNGYFRDADLTIGETLALIHSELSEALEAYRDDDIQGFSEEIADTLIRIFHLVGDLGIDIEKHLQTKMDKNRERPYKHDRKNF